MYFLGNSIFNNRYLIPKIKHCLFFIVCTRINSKETIFDQLLSVLLTTFHHLFIRMISISTVIFSNFEKKIFKIDSWLNKERQLRKLIFSNIFLRFVFFSAEISPGGTFNISPYWRPNAIPLRRQGLLQVADERRGPRIQPPLRVRSAGRRRHGRHGQGVEDGAAALPLRRRQSQQDPVSTAQIHNFKATSSIEHVQGQFSYENIIFVNVDS